jgi:hypothetical protein
MTLREIDAISRDVIRQYASLQVLAVTTCVSQVEVCHAALKANEADPAPAVGILSTFQPPTPAVKVTTELQRISGWECRC